jgi:hypothetical protein
VPFEWPCRRSQHVRSRRFALQLPRPTMLGNGGRHFTGPCRMHRKMPEGEGGATRRAKVTGRLGPLLARPLTAIAGVLAAKDASMRRRDPVSVGIPRRLIRVQVDYLDIRLRPNRATMRWLGGLLDRQRLGG